MNLKFKNRLINNSMPPKKKADKLVFSSDSENELIIESEDEEELLKKESYTGPIRKEELKTKHLNLHKQILLRPSTYIGSVVKVETSTPIWIWKNGKMRYSKIHIIEGLLRLLIEAISNSIDNVWRSQEFDVACKKIKIHINKETGETSVWNDGKSIDFSNYEADEDDTETKGVVSKAKMLFAVLLTSTNYDDTEERKTSGQNGYGIKLCNIFSKLFKVKLYNPKLKEMYQQTWKDNMYKEDKAKITKQTSSPDPTLGKGSGFTEVTWTPDFKRFGVDGYDDDMMSIMEKIIYDTAMLVSKYNVSVEYNDEEINIHNLKNYADVFLPEEDDSITFISKDCRVVLKPSPKAPIRVSFVNGINTSDGGVHVDAWEEEIFRPIVNKLNGVKNTKETAGAKNKKEKAKDKKAKTKKAKEKRLLQIDDVHKHFAVFIDAVVDKPVFGNQNKTKLSKPKISLETGRMAKGKSVPSVKPGDITKIMKWDIIERIRQLQEMKDLAELNTGNKRGYHKIEGVDHANFARRKSAKRQECILCITEGKSARTYVVQGMQYGLLGKKGRDYIGTFAIRGKFLNPKGKSMKSIGENPEVQALIGALGIETNVDYTDDDNFKKLKYGKIVIFADADTDGFHIIGLLYNFFHTLYPSLILRPNFFYFMRTPLVKINHNNERLAFYYNQEAQDYIKKHNINPKKSVEYFKGLGTTNRTNVKNDFGKRPATIVYNEEDSDKMMHNVFGKKNADFRKDWLLNYDPTGFVQVTPEDYEVEEVGTDPFFNYEFINHPIDNCRRTIPCLYDGLKESQRKILYCAFLRKLKSTGKSLKVAQFSGYVAEHSAYHHGEDNLIDTIKGMAVRFVGSNNMPLLFNDGQFGSRLSNGDDGASGRYIFTKPERYTRALFPSLDDVYIPHVYDNGQMIEKVYYLPVIPIILVNGTAGIGTGFSSDVPCFNPIDLINWIKVWIKTGGQVIQEFDGVRISEAQELLPWYRNFKGNIKYEGGKIKTYGVLTKVKDHKYKVTELPVGKKNISIEKFKDKLEDLLEKKIIKAFDDHCNDIDVDFDIEEDPDGMSMTLANLGLVDTIHTSNMVLFWEDEDGIIKLRHFETVEDIINEFCKKRKQLYIVRREGVLKQYKDDLNYTKNKIKFLEEINSDDPKKKLIVFKRKKPELYIEMEERGYVKKPKKMKAKKADEDDDDDDDENAEDTGEIAYTYDYLLGMRIDGATDSKLDKLNKEKKTLKEKIDELESKTPEDLWLHDLDVLEKEYLDFLPYADESREDYSSEGKKKKKSSKKNKSED